MKSSPINVPILTEDVTANPVTIGKSLPVDPIKLTPVDTVCTVIW